MGELEQRLQELSEWHDELAPEVFALPGRFGVTDWEGKLSNYRDKAGNAIYAISSVIQQIQEEIVLGKGGGKRVEKLFTLGVDGAEGTDLYLELVRGHSSFRNLEFENHPRSGDRMGFFPDIGSSEEAMAATGEDRFMRWYSKECQRRLLEVANQRSYKMFRGFNKHKQSSRSVVDVLTDRSEGCTLYHDDNLVAINYSYSGQNQLYYQVFINVPEGIPVIGGRVFVLDNAYDEPTFFMADAFHSRHIDKVSKTFVVEGDFNDIVEEFRQAGYEFSDSPLPTKSGRTEKIGEIFRLWGLYHCEFNPDDKK